jgi:hypothetical protein
VALGKPLCTLDPDTQNDVLRVVQGVLDLEGERERLRLTVGVELEVRHLESDIVGEVGMEMLRVMEDERVRELSGEGLLVIVRERETEGLLVVENTLRVGLEVNLTDNVRLAEAH